LQSKGSIILVSTFIRERLEWEIGHLEHKKS
jgi:hypothetical protein